MVVNSIFNDIAGAERLQLFIDSRNDKFAKTWYKTAFPFSAPQMSLTYVSILGESNVASAATVVDRDSETPLRSRDALSKLYGEIPAIKVMRKMKEEQYREYMTLQEMSNINDVVKKAQALKLIWDDVQYVSDSIDKRLDFLVAQGLSTGKIKLTVDNNPDGVVTDEIDLLLPADQKSTVSVSWRTANTATPIQNITKVVNDSEMLGLTFGRILIDSSTLQVMLATKEVKDLITLMFGGKGAVVTLDRLNDFMSSARLPILEVVNFKVPIEKNGVKTIVNPFDANNIVFVPDGQLGEIKNAVAVEEYRPVDKVVYAKRENTLISKWAQNEPFVEWTKAELNAFPAFTALSQSHILTVIPA